MFYLHENPTGLFSIELANSSLQFLIEFFSPFFLSLDGSKQKREIRLFLIKPHNFSTQAQHCSLLALLSLSSEKKHGAHLCN